MLLLIIRWSDEASVDTEIKGFFSIVYIIIYIKIHIALRVQTRI